MPISSQEAVAASPRPRRWPWAVGTLCVGVVAFMAGMANARANAVPAVMAPGLASSSSTPPIATTVAGVGSMPPRDLRTKADFDQFWELWRTLKDRYYLQPMDEQKMMYGAMSGLASSLEDPYTSFFEPKVAEEFSQSLQGKFEGIGAEIGLRDEQIQVIAPLKDMPAEKAGILAGDAILKIDGQDTAGMTVEQAVSKIRGDKGTTVKLQLGRVKTEVGKDGKEKKVPSTFEVSIVRDVIVVKSVRVSYKDRVAVIEITNFNQDTQALFAQAVEEVSAKDPKGIVLDLRNDPGGYLDRAVSVASAWVGSDVVLHERRQGKIVETFRGDGESRFKGIPTVVLVNEGSASASEIVAGALQDHGAAKVVGKTSFGKGSVQDYTEFPDGSAVKITIAEWLTPKLRSINKQGIVPDVDVDRTAEDVHANRDPQLDKALQLLTASGTSAVSPSPAPAGGAR